MRRLLLAGAGGFGREVLSWARRIDPDSRDWQVGGFLDDNPEALRSYAWTGTIVGPIRGFVPGSDDLLVVTVGEPRLKLEIADALAARGARFVNLIHAAAVVGENVRLGRGTILCPGACITADAEVGDHVHLNVQASIGHDTRVGDGSTLSGHADLTGFARLGRGVFLGSHATVLPGVEVGDFARVGAGAVVVRRVRPGSSVFGNPARVIVEGPAPSKRSPSP